jgi:hypothetical protein
MSTSPAPASFSLKRYVQQERIVRRWFDAPHDGPAEAFAAEADRHPVFRLG